MKTKAGFHFARPDSVRENDAHMNIAETNAHFAMLARQKSNNLKSNPLGVFISSMLAGAYVGVGIILIVDAINNARLIVASGTKRAPHGVFPPPPEPDAWSASP